MKASFQRCLLYTKKVEIDISTHFLLSLGFPSSPLAEREGFEPPEPLSSTVFKTAAIDHSAISPSSQLACKKKLALRVWFATIAPLNSGSRSPRYIFWE